MMRQSFFIFLFICVWTLHSCIPEMPVSSEITVEGGLPGMPVNPMLYGITLEEANHAIDGGLYAELILNRSFEEGKTPPNCRYDRASNRLITPNGWSIPFVRPDSIPGWKSVGSTYISLDEKEPINGVNKQYLSVYNSGQSGRGGVIATGYDGITLKKGEKYDLEFYVKGSSFYAKTLYVSLQDSSLQTQVSEPLTTLITNGWKQVKHTFTANKNINAGVLSFTTDSTAAFALDDVSLFPQSSYKNYRLRSDLFEHIQALQPRFIRFPGGIFVEGYTQGSYPIWHETVGNPKSRKQFFTINGYTTTNGMGFHEYLQLCEQLNAEPVYVINAGVTNQKRRPRYEDITKMKFLVEDALHAIAYANQPADSTYGAMRAQNGHPEPFNLKYIEIGSEHSGFEYRRRFLLFYEAIKEKYPEISVISNDLFEQRGMNYLMDYHYTADPQFFRTNSGRFKPDRYPRRSPVTFINEFGTTHAEAAGTLEAALAEATFLIGIENYPTHVSGIAYSPLLSNDDLHRDQALINFNKEQTLLSPSYYTFQSFSKNRGHELLKSTVDTYHKPFIESGRIQIVPFDQHFAISEIHVDEQPMESIHHPKINEPVTLPEPATNFRFSANVKREKGNGSIQFRFRQNDFPHGERFVGVNIENNLCELFIQHGEIQDTLTVDKGFVFENERTYPFSITFINDSIACQLADRTVLQAKLPSIPSLATTAAVDTVQNILILKVVNNTYHEERTQLNLKEFSIENNVSIIQLKGEPEDKNTYKRPDYCIPEEKEFSFSAQRPLIYVFPPQSLTIIKIPIN